MLSRPRRAQAVARSASAAACLALLAGLASTAHGQETSDKLRIRGDVASNWVEGDRKVLLIERNVSITTDNATLTADRAVIWLRNSNEAGNYTVEMALAGNVKVVRGDLTREDGELFVTANVRPDVQLDVLELSPADRSNDVHYLAASQLRRQNASRGGTQAVPPAATSLTTGPTTAATRPSGPPEPVSFDFKQMKMSTTPEGKVALVLTGAFVVQSRANGDRVELQAEHAVLFTNLTDARAVMTGQLGALETTRDLESIYLEGDVRMEVTPGDPARAQQSLRASRIVYEFATDRAILTDALLHSRDPGGAAPIVVRASAMKKLGTDVYQADRASITTSEFATPSLALSASKVTVRQHSTNGHTTFVADNVTPRVYGVPVFYFPKLWGSTTEGIAGLRAIQLSNSNRFGVGLATQWGLYETFGIEKPENIDVSYRLDYYTERGPAGGLDANYSGGSVNENTLQPWGFAGSFTSYVAYDSGDDRLGKRRRRIEFDEELRSRVQWNHQQFLTDGWQVQARAGYVSDGTFLEQWFRNEFRNGLPTETSLYLKRTQDTEVFTATLSLDTSGVPTIADQLQEVTVGEGGDRYPLFVERLPEVTYHRLGDSLADDRLTWVSNNRLGVLHFNESRQGLGELGFIGQANFAGLPSYAYTGYTDDYIVRGDTRQEIAYPMGDDRVRITPYVVARYTAYSDSPADGMQNRLLGGVGVRTSTQFSKVYNDVNSKILDVHRLRHIIEPQVNLFASAETVERDEVFIYDEHVDGYSDVEAAQIAVRQRFQTKRGGEGRLRSVDFLTVNSGVNLFADQPEEPDPIGTTGLVGDADSFRGVYYNSMPEASLARSTFFTDAVWRVTDTTAILGDVSWNLDEGSLATTALGVAVQRDPRVSYFAGVRYIGEINSTIGTITFDYEISTRYSIALHQSFDLGAGTNQNTSMELTRKFEQFVFGVAVYFDQIEEEGGIAFTLSPRNLPFSGPRLNGRGGRR